MGSVPLRPLPYLLLRYRELTVVTSVLLPPSQPSADLQLGLVSTAPSLEGAFLWFDWPLRQHLVPHSPLELSPWQLSFYNGQRLAAEVKLLAKFNGAISSGQLVEGSRVLHTSYGVAPIEASLSPFQEFQATLSQPQSLAESRAQYLSAPDCPDALMFWVLVNLLPSKQLPINDSFRLEILRRLAVLLTLRFPQRPDLLTVVAA